MAFRFLFRYDPSMDVWSSEVASLSSPRSGVYVVEMDGIMFAMGGFDGAVCTNIVERYFRHAAYRHVSGNS